MSVNADYLDYLVNGGDFDSLPIPTSVIGIYLRQLCIKLDNMPVPMTFKGTLGEGGTITELPSASVGNTGHVYKVITDGTYAGIPAVAGDEFISDGTAWLYVPSGNDPATLVDYDDTVTQLGATNVQQAIEKLNAKPSGSASWNTLTGKPFESLDPNTLNVESGVLKVIGGGSGGTSNYNDLSNKPKINNVELSGNKTASELGLATNDDLDNKLDISQGVENAGKIPKVNDEGNLELVQSSEGVEIDDTTTAINKVWSSNKVNTELTNKVNTEAGKGLSSNDYTNNDKAEVAKIVDKQDIIPTYTLAEYEAIKDDIPEGTLFNISDDETKVTNVTNNKYSTDQIICGEWVDGKPLYRKVVSIPLVNEGIATAYIYGHGSSALRIHSCIITISDDNHTDGYYFPNTYYDKEGSSYSMGNGSVKITANGQIQITCDDDWSGYTAQCIVEYTRTTD